MRQVIGLVNAIQHRKNLDWYTQLCLHASVRGAKIAKTFSDIFPEYTAPEEEIPISPENAKLIERLQAEHLDRVNKNYGSR